MSKAIVLSGGGAKGAYQVGVLNALHEKGELNNIDCCYGTSVGALNSTGLAYLTIDELTDLWLSIKGRSDILGREWWKLFWAEGLYNLKPLEKTVTEIVNFNDAKRLAKVCRINLESGATEFVSNKAPAPIFIEAVLSSCAIPLIMKPVNKYVDGGVRQHTPLAKAISDGHKDIIVILTSPITQNTYYNWQYPLNKFLSFYKILLRSVDDIMTHEIMFNDINSKADDDVKITFYAPKKIYMDTIEFNPDKIKEAIEAGYNDIY